MTRTTPRDLRVALALVRLASLLLAPPYRREWLREWEAELVGRRDELAERGALTWGARLDLLARAGGAVRDAFTVREGRGMMRGMYEELRLATRSLGRRPGFVAVVVSTLALGVGATTTMFGVARDVLLRPFPYPEPDEVVAVESFELDRPELPGNVTYPNLADLEASTASFEAIALARWWAPALELGEGSFVLRGATVTADFFRVLGVEAGLGRLFRPDEEGEGRASVVVLSHAFWVERFSADPGVVGSDIRLSGAPYTVVGVTGADFEDPWLLGGPGAEPQVWRTVASPPSEWPRSGRSWKGIARVRSDVSQEVAQAELTTAFATLVEAYPEHNADRGMRITPLRERIAGPSETLLVTLTAAVGLLLLIACANLANLMLARALDRARELAVHRALGASAGRVFVRGVAEAVLLAGGGGIAGVAVAVAAGDVVGRFGALLPRPVTGTVDAGLLVFALVVTAGCGVFFGAAPAVHAVRSSGSLGMRGSTPNVRGERLRRGLVVGQVTLTAALLIGSGLFARAFLRLGAVDLGLETAGVVGLELHGAAWYDLDAAAAQAQWDDVLGSVRSVPGLGAAGAIDYLPLTAGYSCDGLSRADQPPPPPGEGRCAEVRVVLPGALEALGVDVLRGRAIDDRDRAGAPPVAVVDETAVATFWPGGADPVGAHVRVHERVHEVVGVARDMLHFGPGVPRRPMVYLPAPQEGWNGITRGLVLVVRGGPRALPVQQVRQAVHDVNPSIALGDAQPLDELLGRALAGPRFRAQLMTAFGATALILALLGMVGIMMGSVARRRRELGVRLALGAEPAAVRAMVLREGVRLTLTGLALGLAGTAVVAGTVESLLFGVATRDPLVYAAVATLLLSTAAVASYLPARRASRVDPVSALQSE
jgi:putative ABC transport system permease protein